MLWVLKRSVSFEHPKHMLKLMGKKIFTILVVIYAKKCFILTYVGFCLFDLILYVPSTIFQLNRMGHPALNQY